MCFGWMGRYASVLLLSIVFVVVPGICGGAVLAHEDEEHEKALGGAGTREGLAASPFRNKRDHEINWYEWGDEPFGRAVAEDKLILLDLTAVWCHWCHVMDETSYSDPEIIEMLNKDFIAIRIDTDRRPDLQVRYLSGGWPSTDILVPSGEMVFGATYLRPEQLKSVLREYQQLYKEHKPEILKRAKVMQEEMKAAWASHDAPKGVIDSKILTRAVSMMKGNFDKKNGGFGNAPKFFEHDALAFGLLMHHRTGDEELKEIVFTTLRKQLGVFDPVWGGFYRYSVDAAWTTPHYEKMLDTQAMAIRNYLDAYLLTGERRYRAAVEGIMAYVDRFLSNPGRGGFFASQDADVGSHDPHATFVDGEDYYLLGEKERLAIGIPHVDLTVLTHWNGLMAQSYLKVYQALGDKRARDFALKTLDMLYVTRYRKGEGIAHYFAHGKPQRAGLLVDQVAFARALIEAYVVTADRSYLQKAEMIIVDMYLLLEDKTAGGFFDMAFDPDAKGMLLRPEKPTIENARAAMLLSELYYFTENTMYKDGAERTLQYLLGTRSPYPPALGALAVDRYLNYPLHIVVVGEKKEQITRNLWHESLRVYAPGKTVMLLDPSKDKLAIGEVTFPELSQPAAYVCTDLLCSKPIEKPGELRESLKLFLDATAS